MSTAQIAANRKNARKSTGPKTVEGRAVSKMNAIKHGILSEEVLVRGQNLNENSREFSAMRQRFWEDWNPVGATEEMLVGQILTTHWRLRRALTAESGEIALSVDQGHWRRNRFDPVISWLKWSMTGDIVSNMEESSTGCSLIERWLEKLRATVELSGELTETDIKEFNGHFGGKPNSLMKSLEEFRLKLQENPEGLDAAALRARNKEQTLAFLRREFSFLAWLKNQAVEREESEEEARQAAAVLPSMSTLEKIMRYETMLKRQMFRAMAQLERLQRMRRGEILPAPLSLEVSERL